VPDTPPKVGAHAEGEQLHVAGIDAHGLGRDLVFANRHPCAPDAAALESMADQHAEQDEQEEEEIEIRDVRKVHAEQLVCLAEVKGEVGERDRDPRRVDRPDARAARW